MAIACTLVAVSYWKTSSSARCVGAENLNERNDTSVRYESVVDVVRDWCFGPLGLLLAAAADDDDDAAAAAAAIGARASLPPSSCCCCHVTLAGALCVPAWLLPALLVPASVLLRLRLRLRPPRLWRLCARVSR